MTITSPASKILRRVSLTSYSDKISLSGLYQPVSDVLWKSFCVQTPFWSNCDFGRPCDCPECRDMRRKAVCEICKVRSAEHQTSNYSYDRKGIPGYEFTSFCGQCFDMARLEWKKRADEVDRIRLARKERKEEMVLRLEELCCSEQVPIRYAVERLLEEVNSVEGWVSNSPRWYQRELVNNLSKELKILKVANRYVCDRKRVEAMDFRLWYFWDNVGVDV